MHDHPNVVLLIEVKGVLLVNIPKQDGPNQSMMALYMILMVDGVKIIVIYEQIPSAEKCLRGRKFMGRGLARGSINLPRVNSRQIWNLFIQYFIEILK